GPQVGPGWGGRGGRSPPNIGLDAQPANPHLRRLSLRGDGHHHVIRWNLSNLSPSPLLKHYPKTYNNKCCAFYGMMLWCPYSKKEHEHERIHWRTLGAVRREG